MHHLSVSYWELGLISLVWHKFPDILSVHLLVHHTSSCTAASSLLPSLMLLILRQILVGEISWYYLPSLVPSLSLYIIVKHDSLIPHSVWFECSEFLQVSECFDKSACCIVAQFLIGAFVSTDFWVLCCDASRKFAFLQNLWKTPTFSG